MNKSEDILASIDCTYGTVLVHKQQQQKNQWKEPVFPLTGFSYCKLQQMFNIK